MKNNIFVIHRVDTRNIGDMASAPSSYLEQFPWLKEATVIDIESDLNKYHREIKSSTVILGGGGLLGTSFFEDQINLLVKIKPKKLIAWGVGHNSHGNSQISEPNYLKSFDLVGLRDHKQDDYRWVPCPSAFIPGLENPPKPKHKMVLYSHWKRPILHADTVKYPELTNASKDIKDVIDFLSSGEVVVTNSYHGAYWATLLGRRVIICSPFSTKFYGFKHKLPIVEEGDWHKAIDSTNSYPNALKECRDANIEFSQEIKALLSI